MKKIVDCNIKIADLKYEFGNPRKTNKIKQEIESLKESIQTFGVWRDIGIDENNNVIFGNKLSLALKELNIEKTNAKRLIGYSIEELKAINIKDNEHVGEWDFNLLNDWLKELDDFNFNVKFEDKIKTKEKNIKPYNNIYVFLTIPVNKIHLCNELLNKIKELDFIEYDQSQN